MVLGGWVALLRWQCVLHASKCEHVFEGCPSAHSAERASDLLSQSPILVVPLEAYIERVTETQLEGFCIDVAEAEFYRPASVVLPPWLGR